MKRLKAFWRAFRRRCPACNSQWDQPCEICRPYNTAPFDQPVPDWLASTWLALYFEREQELQEMRDAKRAADRFDAAFGDIVRPRPREFGVTCPERDSALHHLPGSDTGRQGPAADSHMLREVQKPLGYDPRKPASAAEVSTLLKPVDPRRARPLSGMAGFERRPETRIDKVDD
jgi:hypothetical protein